MHEACIRFFLHEDNLDRIIL
ncbi:protein of unknown function [Methylocaldum szegediense]|uniref:Uncharacterized protein n=1 Tax=Methylocaldum szegediense TaxID=73780 RepID=A0ABM9HVT9_9GAMM|nr:protein of unknown function [Methylocaldum szegediense]